VDYSDEWSEEDMRDFTAHSVALFELMEARRSGNIECLIPATW